ncbi:hypothetical protein PISMIDRAFT_16731 [Pisolithus microcarpus 441]|uniref:Uncharacterized protein n=1 Tax=Pisolithus microcarpus 441 TaxID=765257 RepID=A0A0C9YEW4_9AGAM|nr:hypothetical protein PISMIDRAFT_16731 [Pisolithus microcarpus 441]
MAASDPRKQLTQSNHTFPQETGPDACKKPRKVNPADTSTYVAGTESMHRSSRMTKGSSGQIAQLQNIECIQTEQTATSKVSHASYHEMATANEPLNPLAPAKSKPKPKPRVKTSSACASNDGQLPKSLQEPTSLDGASPPTYQVAVKGSRYGFRLAGLDKQHEQDNITMAPTSRAGACRDLQLIRFQDLIRTAIDLLDSSSSNEDTDSQVSDSDSSISDMSSDSSLSDFTVDTLMSLLETSKASFIAGLMLNHQILSFENTIVALTV